MSKADLQADYFEMFGESAPTSWSKTKLTEAMGLTPTEEVLPTKTEAKAKGKFWKNPMFFMAFGTVTGAVTPEQEAEFNRVTPEESKIENFICDHDPAAERWEKAKKASRVRAGLPAEK